MSHQIQGSDNDQTATTRWQNVQLQLSVTECFSLDKVTFYAFASDIKMYWFEIILCPPKKVQYIHSGLISGVEWLRPALRQLPETNKTNTSTSPCNQTRHERELTRTELNEAIKWLGWVSISCVTPVTSRIIVTSSYFRNRTRIKTNVA